MLDRTPSSRRRLMQLLAAGAAASLALPAAAHHGWGWAIDEQSELRGTLENISMAPPHPTLQVKASDGVVWQVDLANVAVQHASGSFRAAMRGDIVAPRVRLLAGASALLWLSTLVSGRWIGFV